MEPHGHDRGTSAQRFSSRAAESAEAKGEPSSLNTFVFNSTGLDDESGEAKRSTFSEARSTLAKADEIAP